MRRRNRGFVAAALLLTLVLAGGVSFWASGSPDGLNKVATELGFDSTELSHASDDSPFAGYGTLGVDDPWLSGATAGVVGVVLCFALASGIGVVLRRRARRPGEPSNPDASS